MISVPDHIISEPMVFKSACLSKQFKSLTGRRSGKLYLAELAELLHQAGVAQDMLRRQPRSEYRPDMLVRPMEKFFQPPMWNPDLRLYELALERVATKFRLFRPVKPVSLEAVYDRMDMTTNAGLPFMVSKGEDKTVLPRARRCLKGERNPPPMIVFHRGKNSEEARPVQGFPFEWHLIEGMFFYPLQDAYLSYHNPYAAGRPRTEVASQINEVAYDAYSWLCLDYSGFDRSVGARLLGDAFRILRNNLSMDQTMHNVFDRVAVYFATGPMLLPDGRVYRGRTHGVPSGSMFTQLVDTLVNAIAIEYLNLSTNMRVMKYWIVGDDSVIAMAGSLTDLAKAASVLRELGLIINMEKSVHTTSVEGVKFLGHSASAKAQRDLDETFQRIVNPERYDPDFDAEDKWVRFARYADILRGHLTDNVLAFPYLERVLAYLEGWRSSVVPVSQVIIPYYPGAYTTRATKTRTGRQRWDLSFRRIVASSTTGPALGALVFY